MRRRMTIAFTDIVILCCFISLSHSQVQNPDSTDAAQEIYDPFGPENSPDHNGRGSGGVITPSPYESIVQSAYTKISADYNSVQFMLDSPLQISPGLAWSTYQKDIYSILFKARSSGFVTTEYDPVLKNKVKRYRLPFEIAGDYSLNEKELLAYKFKINWESYTRSIGMAGLGVVVSNWNATLARDKAMDRTYDIELTWMQIVGGYIMPLSPKVGGVNIAIGGAVDLLGPKVLIYNSDENKFYGAKIGSIGWVVGFGWNMLSMLNLSFYAGGEWSFSSGLVKTPAEKHIRADVGRNTLYSGVQFTGRYFNITGGIQKEQEYLDYLKIVKSEKNLRYYFGVNYYLRR
jgi:hypothetical protein